MKNNDAVLGAAISRGVKSVDPGCCPGLEAIAGLVDGGLGTLERDRLMGHLASCDRCREIFVGARKLSTEAAQGKGRRWRIPSVVAAAALVVIAVTATVKNSHRESARVASRELPAAAPAAPTVAAGESGVPTAGAERAVPFRKEPVPTLGRTAQMLARSSDMQQLSALTVLPARSYGFAGDSGTNSVAFRIGVNSVALEVALLAGDGGKAHALAARLVSLLQSVAGDDRGAAVEALAEKMAGNDQGSAAGRGALIEGMLPPEMIFAARLGAWVEGGRLAAKTGQEGYFAGGVPGYFRDNALRAGGGARLAALLQQLERSARTPGKIDFRSVEQILDEIAGSIE